VTSDCVPAFARLKVLDGGCKECRCKDEPLRAAALEAAEAYVMRPDNANFRQLQDYLRAWRATK
jgi:hypothetical protein